MVRISSLRIFNLSLLSLAIFSLVFANVSSDQPSQDYQNMAEIYDWLTDHDLERRELPSMRLRFGKRDNVRGMWTVAQRSMPSLRLRFGKRDDDDQLQSGWINSGIERRGGGSRSPALRMRFGKRKQTNEEDMFQTTPNENQ
ncbi:UNVERIFIED_CONTAM: hypothetical protein RMT77_012671 [Armadillidium vulgare]